MNNIKEIRLRRKISRRELSEKLKVSQQAISKWELNLADPKWAQAPLIADVLGCAVGDLFQPVSIIAQQEA